MSGQQRSTNIGIFEVIVCLLSLLQSYAAKRISTKWEGVPFKNVALQNAFAASRSFLHTLEFTFSKPVT